MIGGVKLRRNLRPGPERSVALARWALVAAADAAIATATKASTCQTVSQRGADVGSQAHGSPAPPGDGGKFGSTLHGFADLTQMIGGTSIDGNRLALVGP